MKTDTKLQADVLAELNWESRIINAAEIGVIAKDGVITLTGSVDTYPERFAAVEAAKRVKGVMAVADEIEVLLKGEYHRGDADIAAAALHALKWHINVPHERVKVVVDHGHITLDGEVDRQFQRTEAESAVYYLVGVKAVTNRIRVKFSGAPVNIKADVESAFKRHARLNADRIQIMVQGGKVILAGSVESCNERDEAASAAWLAPGVTDVENRLTISNKNP